MADLKCSALNCTYNKEKYCCKGDIMVGGKHATRKDDTCCESFREGSNRETLTNSTAHPSKTISIDCEAVKCVYNSDYKCRAEKVKISGSHAGTSRETVCATFKEK